MKNVTWATGLTPEGRPIVVPDMEPSLEGKRVCPSLDGASNWYSTSFNPATGLYYVQTNDKCGIFTKTPMEWEAGKGFMGGSFGQAPDEPAQRVLRAIDIQTGKIVVGAAADRRRQLVGRRAQHRGRRGDLRRRQRRADGRRRRQRQAAVELSDEPALEGVADDLHVRQQAVRRGRRRVEHHRVWVAN